MGDHFSQKLASASDTHPMSELAVTEGYRPGAEYGGDPCMYNVGIDIMYTPVIICLHQ